MLLTRANARATEARAGVDVGALTRAAEQTRERMREEQRRAEQRVAEYRENPTAWLHGALQILAAHWQPDK